MSKRLVLAGYFGCGNLGDDAILQAFAGAAAERGYEMRVLSGNVEMVMRRYGLQGVHRLDHGRIKEAIDEADALVFPGGSIFQDVTSVRSVAYYSNLVKMAKKSGKRVALLGQGLGSLNRFLGRRMAQAALAQADVIVLRDQASLSVLQSLGIKTRVQTAADLAYLLPEPKISDESQSFGVGGMKTVGLAPRPWGNDKGRHVVKVFGELAQIMNKNGFMPVMIEMDSNSDRAIIQAISKQQGGKVPELKNIETPAQLQQRLARMESVIAMRLHAGILAATVGVPPYMVSYDPKVTAFANSLGFPAPPKIEGLTAERLFDGFQSFIKDRERTAESVRKMRAEMAKSAEINLDALDALFG